MDLAQLQTFSHVARLLNFSRAAEALNLSQPAVSRQINALERQVGLELFGRGGRTVTLTEAGRRLLAYADRILATVDEANRALAELKNLESGRLVVGASTTPGNYLLAPLITRYQQRYPGIELRMEIRDSQTIAATLAEGHFDLAVLAGPVEAPDLYAEPCLTDELVPVGSPGHRLLARRELSLEDLLDERLIVRQTGSNTRRTLEAFLDERGMAFRQVTELGDTEAIKRAVAEGIGIAFVSRYAISLELKAGLLAVLPGQGLGIPRQFVVAHLKGLRLSPASLAFQSLLRKMRGEKELPPA